ncbi:MAG: energy transducer TonB [Bacteroidota bacterium]
MNQEITNVRLQFTCDKNWENMTDAGNGKYCHSCKKTVYDFSDVKQSEFLAIMAQNNNNVCGRFSVEQMAPQPTLMPVWKKWISAAMILIGINIFNNKAQAQTKPATSTDQRSLADTNKVFGEVMYIEPHCPGGIEVFSKFLADNIQYKDGIVDGRVILSFIIKKDGSLSDIKALRGVSAANNEEAMRVLKLSPKWIVDPNFNNPKGISYTVPIMFKRKG